MFASKTSRCITRPMVLARRWCISAAWRETHVPGRGRSSISASTIRSSASTTEVLGGRAVPTCLIRSGCSPRTGLMDALGIRRAHIYGISMGGCIVQEVAINHPDRVLSLIINCSFAKFDRFGARITENIMNVYKSQGAAEAARHITIACYMPAYFNSHKEEIDAKEKAIADAQRPAHAFIHSALACLEHDSRTRLGSVRIPTLVNCGD